jgi:hypothetical protein
MISRVKTSTYYRGSEAMSDYLGDIWTEEQVRVVKDFGYVLQRLELIRIVGSSTRYEYGVLKERNAYLSDVEDDDDDW